MQSPAQTTATDSETIVLEDVRLIDGSGDPPVQHASVVIRGEKIQQVVRAARAKAPAGARVLNLSGKSVMPGIINAHGHLGLVSGTSVSSANYTRANVEKQLETYERHGITTVVSLGMNQDLLYEMRAAQEKGQASGATILTADRGIGVPGGMPPVNVNAGQIYRPASPEEARANVREMATRAPNLVKIWVDDNLHTLPAPNPAVVAAVIDEAHKQKLRVAAHVYYLADAKHLIEEGIDILAHSVRDKEIDPDTISLMTKHGVFYIPTLQLEESFYAYAEHPAWMDSTFFEGGLDPELSAMLKSDGYRQKTLEDPATAVHRAALKMAMTNLMKLRHADAGIGFGTDSGANPYRIAGFAEHRELQLMVEAGMTPLDALHRATAVNAKVLQIDKKTGTIEAGKQADLVVVNGDPSRNIADTEKIAMVFHQGRQVMLEQR